MNSADASSKLDSGQDDGSLTGRVGTVFYVSPEMMNSAARYNQVIYILLVAVYLLLFHEWHEQQQSRGN
jgi:hypothetical protein